VSVNLQMDGKSQGGGAIKLYFIASHPLSVSAFLLPHLKLLNTLYLLRVLANTNEVNLLKERGLNIPIGSATIVRKISLFKDIQGLWQVYRRLRIDRPNAVHTVTPKAGLIGMLAGWLAGVPVRVHTFTGQVWVTRKGLMRWLLKAADRCTANLATDVLVDSPSQRKFLIDEGVVLADKSSVLASGSICGVDLKRFCPDLIARQKIRTEQGTPDDALVCLYLGRLNRDKGMFDLAFAFAQTAVRHPRAELWIVGPDEGGIFDQMILALGGLKERVKRVGYTSAPERFMQAADLFCLPSYREGFGSSVIEAAACGVPSLTSRIYGLTDAVVEGETGWMHVAGNVQDLTLKLDEVLSDPDKMKLTGLAAHNHVVRTFSEELVTGAMLDFYKTRLSGKS
jgi:glycosyltransferase involved in cell wall biosynthesis